MFNDIDSLSLFSVMPGKGTTDNIFIMGQVQKRHTEEEKEFHRFLREAMICHHMGFEEPGCGSSAQLSDCIQRHAL